MLCKPDNPFLTFNKPFHKADITDFANAADQSELAYINERFIAR
jgi:hypothetical protein